MSQFFDLNSPLMRFLSRLADLMILNMIFLATCLPVVTIGAAWTALYYVAMKMVRDEEGGIVKNYFHAFRLNFRQATILWLGVLGAAAFLILDYLILKGVNSPVTMVMNWGIAVMGAVLVMVLQYLFPLVAKFDAGVKQTAKNAFLLALGHLPRTLLMIFCLVGAVVITIFNGYTVTIGVLVWSFFGFAIMAFSNSCILVKVFAPLAEDSQSKG